MEPARLNRILRQHVRTDQLLGVDAVPVGEVDRTLAPVVLVTQPPVPASRVASVAVTSRPATPAPPAAQVPPASAAAAANLFGKPAAPPPPPTPTPTTAASAPSASTHSAATPMPDDQLPPLPVYPHAIDRNTKIHLLHSMDTSEVRDCRKCGLCAGRTQTVFGEGDPDANLLFIGEGPGENEDLQGRPFIGKAGQKLDEMIKAMGLARDKVYIANVVKCRPPNNRAPTPAEVLSCWDFLKRQIEIIQPRVIVTLGGPATKQILQTDRGITAIRGIWHAFHALQPAGPAVPVMPTFHPAYLLRAYTPENRKKVWSDLQKAMRMLV